MTKNTWLTTTLLKQVSRSFYLSLRFLPKQIREQLSLAYLLARATDTIADTKELPFDVRHQQLKQLVSVIAAEKDPNGIKQIVTSITPYQQNIAERELIKHLPECIELLHHQDPQDQKLMIDLLNKITQGQLFDIEFFTNKTDNSIINLQSEQQLDTYIYHVAGCVGEFWTRLCVLHLPGFAKENDDKLIEYGINFGKGLQLTNILRDLPEDLQLGRLYLPLHQELKAYELQSVIDVLQEKNIYQQWHQQAKDYLQDGWRYASSLKNIRLRFACFMPLFLALSTLKLLTDPEQLSTTQKIKVPRKKVYRIMLMCLSAAFSQKVANYYYQKLNG